MSDHLAPDEQILGVAALEIHQLLPRLFHNRAVVFACSIDLLVKTLHFGDRIALEGGPIQAVLPPDEQLPELRAPIADMIVGDDAVPEEPQRSSERIPEDRRADMAHVHGL